MQSINEIQDEIIEDFSMFEDWMDKYEYIIEIGKSLPPIDEQYKAQQNLIEGCQSRVWLNAELNDKQEMQFSADSDAIITRGLVALLVKVLNGQRPKAVIEADLYVIDKIGLAENLSPTRANGLVSMLKQMRMYAIAYQSKLDAAGVDA